MQLLRIEQQEDRLVLTKCRTPYALEAAAGLVVGAFLLLIYGIFVVEGMVALRRHEVSPLLHGTPWALNLDRAIVLLFGACALAVCIRLALWLRGIGHVALWGERIVLDRARDVIARDGRIVAALGSALRVEVWRQPRRYAARDAERESALLGCFGINEHDAARPPDDMTYRYAVDLRLADGHTVELLRTQEFGGGAEEARRVAEAVAAFAGCPVAPVESDATVAEWWESARLGR